VSGADTVEPIRYEGDDAATAVRKRRALYIVFTTVVTLIVALAAVEWLVGSSVYGVDTATTSAAQGGAQLEVHHPTVTRGQLATPLEITVTRQDGFSEPIVLSITADYLSLFLSQGASPRPTAETATADDLILTFDPPPGDTFVVAWNLQAKAVGSFTTANAHIALLDSSGQATVAVDFDTKVRP
jgi:hypothetical protein